VQSAFVSSRRYQLRRTDSFCRQFVSLLLIPVLSILIAGLCRIDCLAATSEYMVDVWSGDNGLPNSSVTAIAQTPEGYLWIGTHNGLARFDGVRFVTFDPVNMPKLKHARIRGLFVDGRGTLWINTYDNSLTSWRNGVFTHEYQAQQVASVFSRSNEILFAMQGGDLVSRKGGPDTPGEWRLLKPAGRTTGVSYHEDARSVLWYNTRDGAVGRLTGTNSEVLASNIGLDGQRVNCLTSDPSGNIWVGTDKGIAVWDGNRFRDRTPTNGEPELNVLFLHCVNERVYWVVANDRVRKCEDRQWVEEAESWGTMFGTHTPALGSYNDQQGGVWFRHFGQGVFHARPDGAQRRISSADGLPGERITCWFQDREGNVWVGADRGGLVRLREKRFQVIGPAEGLPAPGAVSVCEDSQGAIWIGTYGGGLNRWQDGRLHSFTLPEGPTKGFIFSAWPDDKARLWLSAGREDLFVYEAGRITQPPWAVHGIKATLLDRRGRLWLGRNNGLSCLDNGVLESFGPSTGLESTDVHALAEDKDGDIWAGGGNGVLYRFHEDKFTAHRIQDKFGQQAIWSLLPDADGTIWIGTFRGGLLRLKDGKFTRYTTDDGLPSDVICQILDDGTGELWIGSHKGIFHAAKSAFDKFASGESESVPCVAYGIYDGLPTLECSGGYQPAAWRGRDGRLWFATFKGVVSIHPDEMPANRLQPPVVLEEVKMDGKSALADLANRSGDEPAVRIPPGKHYFQFRYTALSFTAPDKVRFRYRLDGLENEWMEAGDRREAHYSHLPPGDYDFRVIACNNDGVWNEAGAALAFTILPYFYETAWFRVLVVIIVLGTVAGTVRFFVVRRMHRKMEQLERQRAVERDRARIARDIHDDLGAGLTRIMLQSELARTDTAHEVQSHLGQIAETARGLTRTMDEIVWAVDPQHDTLGSLTDYATDFAETFLQVAGIRCRVDLPTTIPEMHLNAELRYNLFLALKEALNNIVKHARATEVWLRLRVEHEGFALVVEDNGRGLPDTPDDDRSDRIVSGHGLSNLDKRLRAVGGECAIRSTAGRGTRVEMKINGRSEGSAIMAMSGPPAKKAD
jgi:signal transduction histidine kinase/ligand-binding sensor domain-containing protein